MKSLTRSGTQHLETIHYARTLVSHQSATEKISCRHCKRSYTVLIRLESTGLPRYEKRSSK